MASKSIEYSTILKRITCLNSTSESNFSDSKRLYENCVSMIEKSTNGKLHPAVQPTLKSCLESLTNKDCANSYCWIPILLMEKFNSLDKKQVSDRILYEYTTRILPYIEDLDYVEHTLEGYDITDEQKNSIIEMSSFYKVADRVITNHNNISKRFNVENAAKRFSFNGLESFVENCASMIDTYGLQSYQKLNNTIEECCYILEKNDYNYDKSELAKIATDYFLLREEYLSNKTKRNFLRTLQENYFLEDVDLSKIDYLSSDNVYDNVSIGNGIKNFLISSDKDSNTLLDIIITVLEKTSTLDIVNNIDKLILLTWNVAKSEIISDDSCIRNCIDNITKTIIQKSIETRELSKESIEVLIDKLEDIIEKIKLDSNFNGTLSSLAYNFINNYLVPTIEDLKNTRNTVYDKDNLDAIEDIESQEETTNFDNFITYGLFKIHNIGNRINNFIGVKESKLSDSIHKRNIYEKYNFNNDSILCCIGEDKKFEITMRQYEYNTDSELEECIDIISKMNKNVNDLIESCNNYSLKSYYIVNPGVIEIKLKESKAIEDLDEALSEAGNKYFADPADDIYLEKISESMDYIENLKEVDLEYYNLYNLDQYNNFSLELFECALEALKYTNTDKEVVQLFGEKFSDYHYNRLVTGIESVTESSINKEDILINNLIESWETAGETPLDIQLEAMNLLMEILDIAGKDPKNNSYLESMADEWDEDEDSDDDSDEDEDEEDDKSDDDKDKNDTDDSKKDHSDNSDSSSDSKDNEKTDKSDNSSDSKESGEENNSPKKRLRLNDIKLGLKGIARKFKNMNTKYKEAARNINHSIKAMVNGFRNAQTNERREQIIRGDILPSFKKIMQYGVVLAGCAIIDPTHVVAPCIAAIAGFAIDKKLMKREKLLLLDEIDTELEVIEKEISNAESDNDIKKYRALLKYKKELKRQQVRIRYNLNTGKHLGRGLSDGSKHPEINININKR